MAPRTVVEQGELEGFAEDSILKFFGIPYAASPVGERRWSAPAAPASWQGVRVAKHFAPACPQTAGASFDLRVAEQSEDCLYLNVWTESNRPDANRPVLVWFHGGGNLGGAGSEEAFDGTTLAKQGATVVTFNYRLGAFGFLAHPSFGANFAVLDHLALLRWVKTNIGAFGGDPNLVTIFGQSAGAVAIRTLLACPEAKGLFHRAIIQSAGFERAAFAPPLSYQRAQQTAEALFTKLGAHDPAALRGVPTDAVKQASHALSGVFPPPGQTHTPANLNWMPIVDGSTVTDDDFAGWPRDVPVLMGCVDNEARYFLKPSGTYPSIVLQTMIKTLGASEAPAVEEALSDLAPYEALDKLFSTAIWLEPMLETVRKFAASDRRFYCYHFARAAPGAIATNELAKHTAEIRYIFGTLADRAYYDSTDQRLAAIMQYAWLSFARTGVPNTPGGAAWPRYDAADPRMAWIEDGIAIRDFPVTPLMTAINKLRERNRH